MPPRDDLAARTGALLLYPFRAQDPRTGKWYRPRYLAERQVIAARYAEWEIIGPPEIRHSASAAFNPWR
jgi:hypothetical protein